FGRSLRFVSGRAQTAAVLKSTALLKIVQEFVVRRKYDAGVLVDDLLVGLKTSSEGVELCVLVVSRGVDGDALCVTFTARSLCFFVGFGEQNVALLVGLRADLQSFLGTFR